MSNKICLHFLTRLFSELYLFSYPLCLIHLEVFFVVVLFCFVYSRLEFFFFHTVRHTREREENVWWRTDILSFFFLASEWDSTLVLFLEKTNAIRDARDLKILPFLMITFNMREKSLFIVSRGLSTERRSN